MGGVVWPGYDPKSRSIRGLKSELEAMANWRKNIASARSEVEDSKRRLDDAIQDGEDWDSTESERDDLKIARWGLSEARRLAPQHERFSKIARETLGMARRGTKYEVLNDDQIKQILSCFSSAVLRGHPSFVTWLEGPTDILDLALETFYPNNVFAKKPAYARRGPEHVILTGHGHRVKGVPRLRVPAGTYIYFYVIDSNSLADIASHLVEGIVDEHVLAIPAELVGPGETVENYYLGYPAGITINLRGHESDSNVIINLDPWRHIPLSALLQDPRCRAATHIHWCACRVVADLKREGWEFEHPAGAHSKPPYTIVPKGKREKVKLAHANVRGTTEWMTHRGKQFAKLRPEKPIFPRRGGLT
jgi:hypothetical protein